MGTVELCCELGETGEGKEGKEGSKEGEEVMLKKLYFGGVNSKCSQKVTGKKAGRHAGGGHVPRQVARGVN